MAIFLYATIQGIQSIFQRKSNVKTSYTFHAINEYRYYLMFLAVSLALFMILKGTLQEIVPFIYTHDRVEYNTLRNIASGGVGVLLGLVIFLIPSKIAYLYAEERWIISFDDKEIELGSNRRPKKVFLISQLKRVEWYKSKKTIWKNMKVGFQFAKGILPQYRISTNKSIFSRAYQKKSYQHFNQFFDDFNERILQTQFKPVISKWFTPPPVFIQKDDVRKFFIL